MNACAEKLEILGSETLTIDKLIKCTTIRNTQNEYGVILYKVKSRALIFLWKLFRVMYNHGSLDQLNKECAVLVRESQLSRRKSLLI